MAKLFLPFLVLTFLANNLALAAQSDMAKPASWSGVIVNNCSPDEASAELPKCTQKDAPGAKLSLYDDTLRQVYLLDPPDQAIGHEGDSVTVSGTLDGQTIHVASLRLLTSFGLAVGQQAPAFSARDQFGSQQTLDTLKGPRGTVLLFFRSADW